MRIKRGITRTVFLVGPLAIKMPSLRYGGVFFVRGMLANMDEAWKWLDADPAWKHTLCPVWWCSWFGLVLVMPRCKPAPYVGTGSPLDREIPEYVRTPYTTDHKWENYGTYKGETVCVDYA